MSQAPVSTLQPALTLTEFVDTTGVFPPRGGAGSGPFLGSRRYSLRDPFMGLPAVSGAPMDGAKRDEPERDQV